MSFPHISVIIPTYNRAHSLIEAIDSVVTQTYPAKIEIIVIDDGSTDDTVKKLEAYKNCEAFKSYQSAERTLQIITQLNNGPSAARNHGIRLAKGDHIAFLDDDDIFEPHKLAVQSALLQKAEPRTLCLTNRFRDRGDGGMLKYNHYYDEDNNPCLDEDIDFECFLNFGFPVMPSTWMASRDVFLDDDNNIRLSFDESIRYAEDGDLFLKHLRSGGNMLVINRPLTTYRTREKKPNTEWVNWMQTVKERHWDWIKGNVSKRAFNVLKKWYSTRLRVHREDKSIEPRATMPIRNFRGRAFNPKAHPEG